MKDSVTITLKGEKNLIDSVKALLVADHYPTVLLIERGEVKEIEPLHKDQYIVLTGSERFVSNVITHTTGTVQITTRLTYPQESKMVRG